MNGISLLGKWLPSENTSSKETKALAKKTRIALNLSSKEYRKMLSMLRKRINVLERLMSSNQWDKIEFDSIPSRAGMIYRDAFARRDMIKEKYREFAQNTNTKVNAKVLYPQEIVREAEKIMWKHPSAETETTRLMLQKYWDNLPDYYCGREENGIAIVDVSGSMTGIPMEAAIGLGAYVAEKSKGPFANHFITFSAHPQIVKFEGIDIVDKIKRAKAADWGMNTNIEAVFDLLLKIAMQKNVNPNDMPKKLYIFSDMQFDECICTQTVPVNDYWSRNIITVDKFKNILVSDFERIANKWRWAGYELPQVIFWNLRASEANFPVIEGNFSYVSGFSPKMIDMIFSGKTGYELMLETLEQERYNSITV